MYSIIKLIVFVHLMCLVLTNAAPVDTGNRDILRSREGAATLQRTRRQFDLRLSAEHDDEQDETEVALEAIANLWRSPDGNTQIEGSARVVHRTNTLETGKTSYKAQLHVHHDYKRKK